MRRCKCRVTGKWGTVSTFYRVTENGKNKYYKDKETYLNMIKEQEAKDKLLQFISLDILSYKDVNLPPFFLKQVNNLADKYSYDLILQICKEHFESLIYWMNQDAKFKNENGRLSYLMAIIKNNINDVYRKWLLEQKRSRAGNKINVDIDLMNTKITKPKSNRDISSFL